jgi:hypothetical protein
VSEDLLKASGLAYSIVRPCGLTEEDKDSPFEMEVGRSTGPFCVSWRGGFRTLLTVEWLNFKKFDGPSAQSRTFLYPMAGVW